MNRSVQTLTTLMALAMLTCGCQSQPRLGQSATAKTAAHAARAAVQAERAVVDAQAQIAESNRMAAQLESVSYRVEGQPRANPAHVYRDRALAFRSRAISAAQLANVQAVLANEVENPREQTMWRKRAEESAAAARKYDELSRKYAALARTSTR